MAIEINLISKSKYHSHFNQYKKSIMCGVIIFLFLCALILIKYFSQQAILKLDEEIKQIENQSILTIQKKPLTSFNGSNMILKNISNQNQFLFSVFSKLNHAAKSGVHIEIIKIQHQKINIVGHAFSIDSFAIWKNRLCNGISIKSLSQTEEGYFKFNISCNTFWK